MGRRVAVVVGDGAYAGGIPALSNPARDAGAVAAAVGALGFDVYLSTDSDGAAPCAASTRARTTACGAASPRRCRIPRPASSRPSPSRRELRAGIADLPRVTFLGGADALHEVPEVRIPGVEGTRGALSYAVAQALRGRVARTDTDAGTVTRDALFGAALQILSQYTDDLQLIEPQPQSRVPEVGARPVFRLAAGTGPAPPPTPAAEDRLAVAVLNGDPAPLLAQAGSAPPFTLVDPQAEPAGPTSCGTSPAAT